MSIIIKKYQDQQQNYYIAILTKNGYLLADPEIAGYLDLPLEEYRDILRDNGGFKKDYTDIQFTKEDIEAAIKALEPYYILTKLIE